MVARWASLSIGATSGQIEREYFSGSRLIQRHCANAGQLGSVAGSQFMTIHSDPPARNMHVGAASRAHFMRGALVLFEQPCVHIRVLMYGH